MNPNAIIMKTLKIIVKDNVSSWYIVPENPAMTLFQNCDRSAMSFWMVGNTDAPPKAKRMAPNPREKEKMVGLG